MQQQYIIYGVIISVIFSLILFLVLKLQRYLITITNLREQLSNLDCQLTTLKKENLLLVDTRHDLEMQLQLVNERLHESQQRINEWEKTKDEAMQYAKAAVFEVGNQLSNKLIEEHKRESEGAKRESQEKIKETTEKLHEQFNNIVTNLAALNSQVKDSKEIVDVVKRALLSPTGAGSLSEITLENILKSSGLVAGRDFIMQYSVSEEGNKLRPDAIVFLPGNNVMIIDSKASKYFIELEIASGNDQTNIILEKLKNTMRVHLKSLISKDYKEAVRTQLKKSFDGIIVNHITSIMFLPSELALEKLQQADNEFINKAWESDIFPAGPIGIVNLLSHARFQISENRQAENHKLITEEVRKLLNSIANVYDYIKKVGNGIHSAASNYDKLAASFNASLLPKAKNLQKLGITMQQNKALSTPLERYQVITSTSIPVINIDAEEINDEELT